MKIFKKNFYIIGEKPQTDWRRVLVSSAILGIIVSVYGFVFYHQMSTDIKDLDKSIFANVSTAATSTVKSEGTDGKLELNQIIELYMKKKENFEKMTSELKKS